MIDALSIAVNAAGYLRRQTPVEVDLDLTRLFSGRRENQPFDPQRLRLIEVDAEGTPLDERVPFQFDAPLDFDTAINGTGMLIFVLTGETAANAIRHFRLSLDCDRQAAQRTGSPITITDITITDDVEHAGQASFEIRTPAARYLYHKQGAGFASMIDGDGHDWLSYRPGGGSEGKYRGIPNLVYPEGFFHAGSTAATSRIVNQGPLKVTIFSETLDKGWACTWEIFSHSARLTVLRAAHPYWFLYEGTPGGKLDEAEDYIVRSPGIRTSAAERWDGQLPEPRWIYVGAGNVARVLYLLHHAVDGETDSYWPMEQNMTVFGFGRRKLISSLTKVPAQFTIGFAETTEQKSVMQEIAAIYRTPEVTVT